MRNSKNMCRINGDGSATMTTTKEIQTNTSVVAAAAATATLSPLIGNLWIREGATE